MKKIRIGIIGLGIMGSNHLKFLKNQPENYENSHSPMGMGHNNLL